MRKKSVFMGVAAAIGLMVLAVASEMTHNAGSLVITGHHIKATPPNAKVAAGYLEIENTGDKADRLLGGDVDFAGKVEVHEMNVTDGVMKMRPLADGLVIQPGETVTLKSGAEHLMFMRLKEPMKEGEMRSVKLRFEQAGEVEIMFPVGSMSGGHSHSGHSN